MADIHLLLIFMELNPWVIHSDLYEPAWDRDAQKLVWNESFGTILYLPSFIRTISEAEGLLEHSYRRELELPNCPWHVRDW